MLTTPAIKYKSGEGYVGRYMAGDGPRTFSLCCMEMDAVLHVPLDRALISRIIKRRPTIRLQLSSTRLRGARQVWLVNTPSYTTRWGYRSGRLTERKLLGSGFRQLELVPGGAGDWLDFVGASSALGMRHPEVVWSGQSTYAKIWVKATEIKEGELT